MRATCAIVAVDVSWASVTVCEKVQRMAPRLAPSMGITALATTSAVAAARPGDVVFDGAFVASEYADGLSESAIWGQKGVNPATIPCDRSTLRRSG